MKVGISIPNFGPDASPWWLSAWATRAEQAGFHFVMLADHVPSTRDVHDKYVTPFYEPFTALSWIAAQTSRIRIGASAIVAPHRHPLQIARMAAAVDQFSYGRLVLGLVHGWSQQEYEALGLPYEERGAMFDEWLLALETLWEDGEPFVSFEGRYVSFADVARAPQTVSRRRPPVWIGANHPNAIRRTVRHGDAWHPAIYDIDWLGNEGLPLLRREAERQGRAVPDVAAKVKVFLTDEPIERADRRPGEGTLEQITDDLRRIADLGVGLILLDTDDPRVRYGSRGIDDHWRVLGRLADEVLDLQGEGLRKDTRADVAERLRDIWEEQLGFPVESVDDDFFDLGGDSLMALTVARRAAAAGIPLASDAVLEHSTLRELTALVSRD